jgi:hypothetical protein
LLPQTFEQQSLKALQDDVKNVNFDYNVVLPRVKSNDGDDEDAMSDAGNKEDKEEQKKQKRGAQKKKKTSAEEKEKETKKKAKQDTIEITWDKTCFKLAVRERKRERERESEREREREREKSESTNKYIIEQKNSCVLSLLPHRPTLMLSLKTIISIQMRSRTSPTLSKQHSKQKEQRFNSPHFLFLFPIFPLMLLLLLSAGY